MGEPKREDGGDVCVFVREGLEEGRRDRREENEGGEGTEGVLSICFLAECSLFV